MKNSISVFLFLLSLIIISCDNDDIQDETNFISSKINEMNWKGVPEISLNQANDTLTLLGSNNEQVIVFKIMFKGERVYDLSEKQVSFYTTVGRDAIVSWYELDANFASQITITEYNPKQNILKGNFELLLHKKWSNPENSGENLLSFTNGEFKGVILDYTD